MSLESSCISSSHFGHLANLVQHHLLVPHVGGALVLATLHLGVARFLDAGFLELERIYDGNHKALVLVLPLASGGVQYIFGIVLLGLLLVASHRLLAQGLFGHVL